MLNHEHNIGAELLYDSLTDMVVHKHKKRRRIRREPEPPVVARVNRVALKSIQAAAHPGLEVLSIGVGDGKPLSLAPVTGLPRLRTLTAYPGTLADPLEIARLTGLEFLELGRRSGVSSSTPKPSRALCQLPPSRCTATGTRPRSWHSLTNSLPSGTAPPITQTTLDGHLRH